MGRVDYEAVILDMDGVITKTAKLHAHAWKQMFDEYLEQWSGRGKGSQPPFSTDDYREYVDGKPRYDGVRSFLESRAIQLPEGSPDDLPNQETVCGLGNRKYQRFHQLLQQDGVEVYDDTIEKIGNWKRKAMKVAVVSSSRSCVAVLKAAGVIDLFDAKLDGNDIGRLHLKGKPAPDMFVRAAAELQVAPEGAIVVEDALAGVEAGRAGQFGLVVGVARNGDHDQLRRHGADTVVSDLRELE